MTRPHRPPTIIVYIEVQEKLKLLYMLQEGSDKTLEYTVR